MIQVLPRNLMFVDGNVQFGCYWIPLARVLTSNATNNLTRVDMSKGR